MSNHVKYLPLSIISVGTLLASGILPFIGNPVAMCIGTAVLFLTTGSNMWLMYLLIGAFLGQIPMLFAQGFHLSNANALCAIASLVAWAIGLIIGTAYDKKVPKISP